MDFEKLLPKKSSLVTYVSSLQVKEEIKKPLEEKDYFRASSILNMCAREEALYHKYKIDRKEKITATLSRTFSFGRAYERFFRDEVLANSSILVGQWKCLICTTLTDKRISKPPECFVCGGSSFSYEEEKVESEEFGIGGHPDGILDWEGELRLLELKTANTFNFAKYARVPYDRHVAQMQIYMHLLGFKKGHIWYFNKDTSQDVCHDIDYSEMQVIILLDKPKKYRQYLKTGELPDRICFDKSNARANKCAMCKLCFLA